MSNHDSEDWLEYERIVTHELKRHHPTSRVEHNTFLEGYLSQRKRQIDVLLTSEVRGVVTRVVVDCKCINRAIDVPRVESFLGFLRDVRADAGIMVTTVGYSDAAMRRANNDELDVALDVIRREPLSHSQADIGGIIYIGRHKLYLVAPIGWVVSDAQGRPFGHWAVFTPRGHSLREAMEAGEWIEVDFFKRDLGSPASAVDRFIEDRFRELMIAYPRATMDADDTPLREKERTFVRRLSRPRNRCSGELRVR